VESSGPNHAGEESEWRAVDQITLVWRAVDQITLVTGEESEWRAARVVRPWGYFFVYNDIVALAPLGSPNQNSVRLVKKRVEWRVESGVENCMCIASHIYVVCSRCNVRAAPGYRLPSVLSIGMAPPEL
jgi:hypothetical protein